MDDRADRDHIEGFPLALYAAQCWATHVQEGNVSSRIKDGIECLFDEDKPHFATWLWIYNEDRGGSSMSTMCPETPEAVPLYHAARFGLHDLVEHLIAKHPGHVNAKGGREMTPTHVAASEGQADILSLLFDHGADLNGRDKYGDTPLHRATWNAKVEAGQVLLNRGADINIRNDSNNTALIYATAWGFIEFVRMLLEHDAAVDVRGNYGKTPLHWAAENGQTEVVRLLLERGADVNVRDEDSDTPSRLASRRGHQEIVELLRNVVPSL